VPVILIRVVFEERDGEVESPEPVIICRAYILRTILCVYLMLNVEVVVINSLMNVGHGWIYVDYVVLGTSRAEYNIDPSMPYIHQGINYNDFNI
jgi:hypothetical protein